MADDRISPTVSQAFQHESTKEKSFGSIAATPAAGKGKPKALQFAQQSVFQSDLGPFLRGTNEECIGHLFFFPAIINKPDPDPWGTPRPAAAKATLIHHLAVRAKNKKMQPRAVHGRPINIIWGKRPLKKKELDSKNNAGGVKSRFNQLSQQDLPAEMISRRHCN